MGIFTRKLKTHNSSMLTLRDEADEDTAIVLTSTSDFAQMPATAIAVGSDNNESEVNAVQIQMYGGSADGKTFTWKLYGWRNSNGIATLMCDGTAILGAMEVVKYPNKVSASIMAGDTATSKFWADTIVVSNNYFVKTFSVSDSGNDRAATLWGDIAGYKHLYLEITSADGSTGTEAGDVGAFYAGW